MNKREEKKHMAKWYKDNKDRLYAVVRQIIDKTLATDEQVSIYWVREMVLTRIHGPLLFNIALAKGRAKDDGDYNVRMGAEVLVKDCLRAHRAAYVVTGSWISASTEHTPQVTLTFNPGDLASWL